MKEEGGELQGQWEVDSGKGGGSEERMQGEHKKETLWQHKDRNKDNDHKAGC